MNLFQIARLLTGFLFSQFVLSGCSSHAPITSISAPVFLTVPFIQQEDAFCGPSSVAMVLAMNQQQMNVDALAAEMVLPAKSGSLQVEVKSTIRRSGNLVYKINPSMDGLAQALQQGYPIIALVNLSFDWLPKWHYVVVTGIDPVHQDVIVHSGDTPDQHWSMLQFENLWSRGKHWAVAVIPPKRYPPSFVDETKYLRATLDLIHTDGGKNAGIAFQSALSRWPDDLTALIGLGNIAYQDRDMDAAIHWFRTAVEKHPDSIVAKNNLAQVLMEYGAIHEAFELAKDAVRMGGGKPAQDTLDQILHHLTAR